MFGTDFSAKELKECANGKKLLGIGLELTRKCNLKCIYCYAEAGKPLPAELEFNEILDVVNQALALGVKKIGIIGGGEPLIYPMLRRLMEVICSSGQAKVSVFTNGTLMSAEWASFFFDQGISIVQKLNSLNETVQDFLTGKRGTYEAIMRSLDWLFAAGYPAGQANLTIETVVLPENIGEIPEIWRWARKRGITPMVERVTPQGRAAKLPNLCSANELRRLFEKLSAIDESEFSISWQPRPPIAGVKGCRHHLYALYVCSDGVIQPCSGVTLAIGSIREQKLASIIRESEVIKNLRHIETTVKGKCRSCEFAHFCYGCRGAALSVFGDYLAEDPFCWVNSK